MSFLPTFLRSLLLTVIISFIAPLVLLAGLLVIVCLIGYVPGLEIIGQTGVTDLWKFLSIFGNGSPIEGAIVIGVTCSLAGALFDTYTFYSYQNLNDH
ncbi:MAG TPA: hypothetical protein DDZ80_06245 [Cyanobacteria bacterium UBA8803]|nr:hypothetical protein [Cyanobacteria bacterium UBA9273]HBL58134.1 hypothetical protein [Cyanobacteria bacterium UBA8803]